MGGGVGDTVLGGHRGRSLQRPQRGPLGGARAPWQEGASIGARRPGGVEKGSDAASPLTRSALGVGDWREPGAASERAGGWNRQPGLSH